DPSSKNRGLRPRDILYAIFYAPEALRLGDTTSGMLDTAEYRAWVSRQELRTSISHSLPVQPAYAIVGRDDLLCEAKALLFGGACVIFVGMPGVGKTALAIKLIVDNDVRTRFFSGVLWVRLGRDADMLARLEELATRLGVPSQLLASAISINDRSAAARQA